MKESSPVFVRGRHGIFRNFEVIPICFVAGFLASFWIFGIVKLYEYVKKTTIGENTKKYRKCSGISQGVFSKKADLAFHTIAKIEAGSTPNSTIDTVKND